MLDAQPCHSVIHSHVRKYCAPLFLSLGLLSPSVYALTMEQAWQAAKQHDPSYAQAQIQAQISETDIRSSKSALLPDFSASASSQWDDDGNNTDSYVTSLNQTIWDSSQWALLDQSQAAYVAAQLKVQIAHNDLAGRVINAYFDLASAQGNLELAEQKFDEGARLQRITEQRYKAGKIRSTELEDMHANHVDEQATIYNAQAEIEANKANLMALVNLSATHIDEINTSDFHKPNLLFNNEAEWLKTAQNQSPQLLAAQQEVKAAQFSQDSAKSGYYPTVSGSLSYSDDDVRRDGNFGAGLSVKIPLDLNGSTRAQVDRSQLQVLIAKQSLRQVEIDIKKEIQSRFQQIELNWQQVEIAQLQVASREKVLKSKQAVYDAGMTDASELIDAHNSLFSSKNALQARLYAYWRQRVALLQAVGKLNDDTIAYISKALQS